MAKRKKRTRRTKKKTGSSLLKYTAWFLALTALVLISLITGYYFGANDGKTHKKEKSITKHKSAQTIPKAPAVSVNKRLQEVLKKETKTYVSAAHEIDNETLANPPKQKPKKVQIYTSKPKLAIIIDDMQTASQVRAVKRLHLNVTMSFLPPRAARPDSAKLASHEKFYMVHLPMEAMHFSAEEPHTLRIHDSQQKISAKIKDIKKLFPKVAYINNHTGSKFTSNEIAMNRLVFALNANHIRFIDSRTTAKTMAPKVLKNFGLKYVARDVFLDHHMDKPYILKQIKKAIAVAKAHGSAIAIGHPHKNTLQALSESKALFKDVELVQINKIY
ncbi:divergent polysaccharide deacetylase family protein [Sulfurimonas hydrogeniphila]|uniref:divergent polysaccharide deacetylase family protein n=1 Tax=Sulfurimonas hydrogeniphila TaxID=2509341 RepID=UPI00125F65CA|nr:divergent polysaccharide deacetylase family protein [Sulfurimonas hydrogeniphila]